MSFTPFSGTRSCNEGKEGSEGRPHLSLTPTPQMNCREFRRKHDAYVDDTLSGLEVDAMALHLRFCPECARSDTRLRRALLLAHNIPTIEPSASFADRLQTRLQQERAIMASHGARHGIDEGRWRSFGPGTYAALATGVALVASVALASRLAEPAPIRLAPVVASRPEPEPSTLATAAMVASMPAGFSVWPAVHVAQQAPWHFADDQVK